MHTLDLVKLAEQLEKEVCSICKTQPKVEVEDGKLVFTSTCCNRFKEQLLRYAQHKMKKYSTSGGAELNNRVP